jgi:hypothetical protein
MGQQIPKCPLFQANTNSPKAKVGQFYINLYTLTGCFHVTKGRANKKELALQEWLTLNDDEKFGMQNELMHLLDPHVNTTTPKPPLPARQNSMKKHMGQNKSPDKQMTS